MTVVLRDVLWGEGPRGWGSCKDQKFDILVSVFEVEVSHLGIQETRPDFSGGWKRSDTPASLHGPPLSVVLDRSREAGGAPTDVWAILPSTLYSSVLVPGRVGMAYVSPETK